MIDPFAVLEDVAPEWRSVATELIARLVDPSARWLTPKERAAFDAVIQLRPFLITNAQKARCRRCGQVHAYLTLACVERPFSGWSELLMLVRDQSLKGLRLGDIVPITLEQARALAEKIRARGEPFPDPPDPRAVEALLRTLAR